MLIGLDHFIVAVPDPDQAATELERAVGLHAGPGGRHTEYGSFNRLLWLGDSYIELLGIADRALAERAWFGRRALQILNGSGAGYVGLAFASDDLTADVQALHAQGSVLGAPQAGERARPDGGTVRWKVATAEPDPDVGHLFLIEHDSAAAEWTPEDRARRAVEIHPLGGPARLARVELPVADMQRTTLRLHRDLGLQFRPSLAGGGSRDASVGEQLLRLSRASAAALPLVAVHGGEDDREAVAFGCRWLVGPAA